MAAIILIGILQNSGLRNSIKTRSKHYPKHELCESDKCNTNDLTHHKLKRLYGRKDHFHNTIGLLLHNASHHLYPIEKNEHIDQYPCAKTNKHKSSCIGLLCVTFLIYS